MAKATVVERSLRPVGGSVALDGDAGDVVGVVVSEGGSVVDGGNDPGVLDVVLEPSSGGAVLEVDESTTVVVGADVVVVVVVLVVVVGHA